MDEAAKFLASLEERIKTQLSYEYHDHEQAQYEYETMTVPRLLDMLNYMFQDGAR